MKFPSTKTLLLGFATTLSTIMTSCSVNKQLDGDGLYPQRVVHHDEMGKNGVRQMADITQKNIKDAAKIVGSTGWDFHVSERHPNNGYLYSRPVEISSKKALRFRYDRNTQQMDVYSSDPAADKQDGASNVSVLENIKPDQFKDANVEPLFREAEELAKRLGPTVVAYPAPSSKGPSL